MVSRLSIVVAVFVALAFSSFDVELEQEMYRIAYVFQNMLYNVRRYNFAIWENGFPYTTPKLGRRPIVGFDFKGWREASRSDRLRWDT